MNTMTSIARSNTSANHNLLALVTAAELMTSEANSSTLTSFKRHMMVDSSLSVVSASDDDEGAHSRHMTVHGMESETLSDDDIAASDPPKAPPPILQPEAPPPAPPPPPPAVVNLNRQSNLGGVQGIVSSSSASSSTRRSDVGSTPSTSPTVLRVVHNKPQSLPITLMNLLTNEEHEEILSFLPHGKCFLIKQTKEFAKKLMQQHFHLSKFGSFVSRLQRWGFAHLQDSILPGQHAFFHPLFVKGKWEPLGKMMYQPKSTKAFKSKLTKSMASRAGLNRSLRNTAPTASAAQQPLNPTTLSRHGGGGGDLASVSQSTVNHATKNIVDAAIACLRRDQELLSLPRYNDNVTVAPPPPPTNSFPRHSILVEPLPPIPPVPTTRTCVTTPRHSNLGCASRMGVLSPSSVRRVSVSPTAYTDNLLRPSTCQMMLWHQNQQQPTLPAVVERPVAIPHPPLPPQMSNARTSAFLPARGANPRQPVDSFRARDYYHRPNYQSRAVQEIVMPNSQAAMSFVPVNSFYA